MPWEKCDLLTESGLMNKKKKDRRDFTEDNEGNEGVSPVDAFCGSMSAVDDKTPLHRPDTECR
jgi:hypothetical protein